MHPRLSDTQLVTLLIEAALVLAGPERLAELKRVHPDHSHLIDQLASGDPSGHQLRYLNWMLKQALKPGADSASIIRSIKLFESARVRKLTLPSKDIGSFKTLEDLEKALERVPKPPEVVWSEGGWTATEVFDHASLCDLGTKAWCVARPGQGWYSKYVEDNRSPRFIILKSPDGSSYLSFFSDGKLSEFKDDDDVSVVDHEVLEHLNLMSEKLGLEAKVLGSEWTDLDIGEVRLEHGDDQDSLRGHVNVTVTLSGGAAVETGAFIEVDSGGDITLHAYEEYGEVPPGFYDSHWAMVAVADGATSQDVYDDVGGAVDDWRKKLIVQAGETEWEALSIPTHLDADDDHSITIKGKTYPFIGAEAYDLYFKLPDGDRDDIDIFEMASGLMSPNETISFKAMGVSTTDLEVKYYLGRYAVVRDHKIVPEGNSEDGLYERLQRAKDDAHEELKAALESMLRDSNPQLWTAELL